jgi:hypothetical protein
MQRFVSAPQTVGCASSTPLTFVWMGQDFEPEHPVDLVSLVGRKRA